MSASGDTAAVLLVIGSLHHDLMIDAPHLPRQGETVTGSLWYTKFGGKGGNQAVAAAGSGCSVRMLGAIGDDDFAVPLRHALDDANIDARWVASLPGHPSGMSVAISDAGGDYGAVIVSGANLAIDTLQLNDDALWQGVDMLLLQNEVDAQLNRTAAAQARRRGIRVCLNAAPAREHDPELAANTDILVVNALEAEALCDHEVTERESGMKAASILGHIHHTVIVTLGGDGVAVVDQRKPAWHLPAVPINVSSTHGAGDMFTGVLCAELLAGATIKSAVTRANDTAARHVSGTHNV